MPAPNYFVASTKFSAHTCKIQTMASDHDNSKIIMQALHSTQKLRESINKTFTSLTDGVKSADDADQAMKNFVTQLQINLYNVNDNFSELEKLTNNISKFNQGSSIGLTGLLSLDPVLDKTPLYQQVLQSYKWSFKLKEHCGHASSLMSQYTMKRSSGITVKKRKMQPNPLTISPQVKEQMISTLNRQFMDIMVINKVPNTRNVYQVTLGRTFHAIVGLRRILIERVVIRGQHENINMDDRMVDIWAPSKHKVFQKITDHATSAMLHYHSPLRADICFRSFMSHPNSDLIDFFRFENQTEPLSLADRGSLGSRKKSNIFQCLNAPSGRTASAKQALVVLLDMVAVIHMVRSNIAKTFSKYVLLNTVPFLEAQMTESTQCIDAVWNNYLKENDLKALTQQQCGNGQQSKLGNGSTHIRSINGTAAS